MKRRLQSALSIAPTLEPVLLVDMKAFARITNNEDDALISSMISGSRKLVESFLGRALLEQTWQATLEEFPESNDDQGAIELPFPPLISVTEFKYTNASGILTTLTETTDFVVDKIAEPGRLVPAYNKVWPVARLIPNAISIKYKAGYGTAAASVPEPITLAILKTATHQFDNRDAGNRMPEDAESLLWPFRLYGVPALA